MTQPISPRFDVVNGGGIPARMLPRQLARQTPGGDIGTSIDGAHPQATTGAEKYLPGFGHVRCLLTPGVTLLFLIIRPHHWWVPLAFVSAMFAIDLIAERKLDEMRQPPAARTAWPFDALLYVLLFVHLANLVLAARLVGELGWFNASAPVALFLTVQSSGIATTAAHELIHRTGAVQKWMGRVLLCSILFEHFHTEHLRNHHHNAATADDPATARLGETFLSYVARNLPRQFISAWRSEGRRLEKPGRAGHNPLRNRVIQGLVLELAMIALVTGLFGWGALLLVLLNAAMAVLVLQAVNYFQHWGLERDDLFGAPHAWDSANQSNLFSSIGMARHADHHLNPGRPYHQLRYSEGSLKLPLSFGSMVWLAIFNNRRFRKVMTEEIKRVSSIER